jgi:hypothetical protein
MPEIARLISDQSSSPKSERRQRSFPCRISRQDFLEFKRRNGLPGLLPLRSLLSLMDIPRYEYDPGSIG